MPLRYLTPVATAVAFCIVLAAHSSFIEGQEAPDDAVCALQTRSLELVAQYVTTDNATSDAVIHQAPANDQAGYEVHTSKGGRAWATMRSNFSLSEQLLTSQQSHGHRCGSHRPMKTPKVCLFLFTALQDEAYRRRTLAVAQTWAASARNLSQATGSFSMHFFVDPKYRHFVESVLPSSEIIEREQSHDNASGMLYYTRLKSLNSALQQSTSCDWVIVPEDDAYMNVPLVTSKLACLDSAGPPRLMGSVFTYADPSSGKLQSFVHGSTWIANAAAVPALLQVAQKQHLAQRQSWGDVAVAECLRDEYMENREQAFPFQEFGCRIIDNNPLTGTLSMIQAHPEPECIDWFHKVLPENMAKLHETVSRRPCQRSSADLMERCVAKFAPL